MKTGTTISVIAHAAVLAFGLVAFAPSPKNAPPPESLPVDIISATEFSNLSKGSRTAPKAETPKPLVERVAEPKPADNPAPKVVDKPEITATADQPPKPPEPKVAEQPKPKPAPPKPEKPREAFASETQPKVDPIAEAIKKDQQKKQEPQKQQQAQQKKQEQQKQQQQQKFDASRIAALLDKRDPQRRAATGETLSSTPALGVPTGSAPKLTQNEIDALRARLRECWNLPVGVAEARDLIVTVRIAFNKDGSLSSEPAVMNHGSHPVFQVAAESALRAVRRCAPYSFMPVAKYDSWKDVIVDFDPRDMFRG